MQMPALLEFKLSLARIGPQLESGETSWPHILIDDVGLTTDIGVEDSLVVLLWERAALPRLDCLLKLIVKCEILLCRILFFGSALIAPSWWAVVVFDEVCLVRYGYLRFYLTD